MNVKEESNHQFKTLHLEVLKTHARLVRKYGKISKAGENLTGHVHKDMLSQEDIASHAKARKETHEAYEAHKNWLAAQLKYFQFIEQQKTLS
jgi:predicted DNA-binding WGR domain protein